MQDQSGSQQSQICTLNHSFFPLYLMLSDCSGSSQELQLSHGLPGQCTLWSLCFCVQATAAAGEQHSSSHGTMGRGPANPCWLETSWTRAASWQQALSHVQSDLMLHHSRGVTQEELGLTLSGGVWLGHPSHSCFPSLPSPHWLAPSEG